MSPGRVVKHLDLIEHIPPRFLTINMDSAPVRNPFPVGRGDIELLLQVIGYGYRWLTVALPRPSAIASLGARPFTAHQTIDAVLATALTQVAQVVGNLAVAINAATLSSQICLINPRKRWFSCARLVTGALRQA